MSYIELKNIKKTYQMGDIKINALDNVSFKIEKGELVAVLGPSGAGKTTVLNILGGMDRPDSGTITVDNENISKYSRRNLITYRRYDIGFVFQFYNLVQNLTALENVELASQICKEPLNPSTVLKQVGLEKRMNNFPSQLSGGEQQRVAIARAIAKNPKLLLCDEPTGEKKKKTGSKILELLQNTCKNMGMTVVIITHNSTIAEIADKIIKMKNGRVEEVILNENPMNAKEIKW